MKKKKRHVFLKGTILLGVLFFAVFFYGIRADYCITAHAEETDSITLSVEDGEDITAILQDAVRNYKEIVIPKGNYSISCLKLNNLSGVKITATGCTIKCKASDTPMVMVQDGCTASDIAIIGGTWDANNITSPAFRFNGTTSNITVKSLKVINAGNDGFRFKATDGVSLISVTVKDAKGYGMIFNDVKNTITINSCSISGSTDDGIAVYNSGDVNVTSTNVSNSTSEGVRFKACNNVVLDSVTAENNSSYGVIFNDESGTTTIKNSIFRKNKNNGVAFYKCGAINIIDSNMSSNYADGLGVYTANTVNIENLTVSDNVGYGILLSEISASSKISKSKFTENTYTGVMITSSNNITVEASESNKNGKKEDRSCYGYYVSNSVVTFNNDSAAENYWSGMSVTGEKAVVVVNKGSYNGNGTRPAKREENDDITAAGIGVYRGASVTVNEVLLDNNHGSGIAVASDNKNKRAKLLVLGCTFTNNGDHGIGGHPNAIVNVKASSNGKRTLVEKNSTNGIILSDNCSSDFIENADVNENGNVGISIITNSSVKYIKNCTFSKNKMDGIRLTKSSKVTNKIDKCKFTSNGRSGIGVYEKSYVGTISSCTIKKSKTSGIRISAATVKKISKVTSTANKVAGISIEGGTAKNIAACTFSSNKQYGLYGSGGSSIVISGSKLNSNTYDGLRVVKAKTVITVSGCTVSSNSRNGVVAVEKGKIKSLTKNTITKNKKYGLVIYANSTLSNSKGNKIKQNKSRQIYVQPGAITSLKTK